MSDGKSDQKATPPYVAYKTLKNFIRSLKQAMPDRIDKSVMLSMSGGAQSQVLHALKYLNLIKANGAPTESLEKLVHSEGTEYQKALHEILTPAYPFMGHMNLSSATKHQIEDEFKKLATGDTVRKCMTFFLPAAKDAGIALSPYIKVGKRSQSNSKPKKQRARTAKQLPSVDTASHKANKSIAGPTLQEILLAKFPDLDPAWPDDVKAKWFESFQKLMQQCQGA